MTVFNSLNAMKKSTKKNVLFVGAILVTVLLTACGEASGGKYKELAQCLTDKGVKMYGAFWCPHCSNQKATFGSDFENIQYIECSPNGRNSTSPVCINAGVKSYPTWFIPGQGLVTGEQEPERLAKLANCEASLSGSTQQSSSSSSQAPEVKASTSQQPTTPAQNSSQSNSQPVAENTKGIAITATGFQPANITIKKGTKVIFSNLDDKQHWPASDDHPTHLKCAGFDSKKGLAKNETYEFTFDKAETCPMHDHLNPNLKGTITVQ